MQIAVLAVARQLAEEEIWRLRTIVVMRDHVHALAILGEKTDLAGAVRLFKGGTAPVLRTAGLSWQRAYFDHRLRAEEDRLPVFRYIFLNPYRAGLVPTDEKWPGYFCAEADWAWFASMTKQEVPFPEWLM